jgi:transposase-like protein
VIVQINESLFNHKSKYNRGQRASKEQWVFDLADTSSKPAIIYTETVDKRNSATLLPIIQRVVKPGAIIHSDQWKAYHNIS